jgi:DNA-binding transcriptional LysR family regulator
MFRGIGRPPRIFANSSISTIEKMALDGLGVALVAEGTLSSSSIARLQVVESDVELEALSFFAYFQAGVRGEIFEQLASIASEVAAVDR